MNRRTVERGERGLVMMGLLSMILVLTVLAALVLSLSGKETALSGVRLAGTESLYAAEGGAYGGRAALMAFMNAYPVGSTSVDPSLGAATAATWYASGNNASQNPFGVLDYLVTDGQRFSLGSTSGTPSETFRVNWGRPYTHLKLQTTGTPTNPMGAGTYAATVMLQPNPTPDTSCSGGPCAVHQTAPGALPAGWMLHGTEGGAVISASPIRAHGSDTGFRADGNSVSEARAWSPTALPASLRVHLVQPQEFRQVAAALGCSPDPTTGQLVCKQPGIERVVDQRAILNRLFAIINVFRVSVTVVAIVMLLSAAALIANTIRIGLFARRKEIGIMKLVGATNWRIRIPFLIEGLVESLIGAGAAVAGLFAVKVLFIDPLRGNIGFMPLIQNRDVLATIPWIIVPGVAVAIAAGLVAMRRFLDV